MQRLEVSGAVRPIYRSVGFKRLRPLLALHPPLSPLTHHRDNVTAPHGRPKLRSRLHSCHAQEGGPRSPQKGHVVALEKKKEKLVRKYKYLVGKTSVSPGLLRPHVQCYWKSMYASC